MNEAIAIKALAKGVDVSNPEAAMVRAEQLGRAGAYTPLAVVCALALVHKWDGAGFEDAVALMVPHKGKEIPKSIAVKRRWYLSMLNVTPVAQSIVDLCEAANATYNVSGSVALRRIVRFAATNKNAMPSKAKLKEWFVTTARVNTEASTAERVLDALDSWARRAKKSDGEYQVAHDWYASVRAGIVEFLEESNEKISKPVSF